MRIGAVVLLLLSIGCSRTSKPVGQTIELKAPLGLPPVPVPADNPETVETISLGKKLFFETKLSADESLSCASCHNPGIAFGDGRKRSVGVGGKVGVRNAPTLVNAAYNPAQFWDGRAQSLEEQVGEPIKNPIEMNLSHGALVDRLRADAGYRAAFEKAFGPGPVTMSKVEKAVASFERTLVSGNSPFDRYEYGGDKAALSAAAIRGLEIFRDKTKGNCAACHTIGEKYALFTDGKYHNIGVGVNDEGDLTDLGRYHATKVEGDKGAFKTPTLRNVALSAPYMHDGSLKTLEDVVEYYAGGGNSNPYLDKEFKAIKIKGSERADLLAFLQSLTGEMARDGATR